MNILNLKLWKTGLIAGLTLAVWLHPPIAGATTNTVTSLSDHGAGSLREAIGVSVPGDTINFSVTGTITLTSGELLIRSLTITGPGANILTIDGNYYLRVFHITAGVTPSQISGLCISNGHGSFVVDSPFDGGGGILLDNSSLNLNNCAITGCRAAGAQVGGGVYNHDGVLNANNCTFSGNSGFEGGGMCNNTVYGITVNNCTFSGNQHAIANVNGSLMINNCTFSGNYGGIVAYDQSGPVSIFNTILAGNDPGSPDAFGAFFSLGHNFIGATNFSSGWVGSDLTGSTAAPLDPLLGPLQDNGGPTFTMALLPASAAIDAGDDSVLSTLTTDQRGHPRKSGAHVDIGAYESSLPITLIVTNLANSGAGSLRQAIVDAAPGDAITFAVGVAGTIPLTSGELLVTKTLNIVGPTASGLEVSGNHSTRVFHFAGGTNSISNLSIINGELGIYGAGIYVEPNVTLNLLNCTLSGNFSFDSGGGLANNGSVFATNCTFSGNSALQGGGVYTAGGPVNLRNCTVVSNAVSGAGGGLYTAIASGSSVNVGSTLVAGNFAVGSHDDVLGLFISSGYNLIGKIDYSVYHSPYGDTVTTSGLSNGVNQDQTGSTATPLNPQLGALADNGGPTFTHALLTGSPAIDKGNRFGVNTDQRGLPRPYDDSAIGNGASPDASDIGAFEVQPASGPVLTVTRSVNGVVIAWPSPSTGFVLQQNANLSTANWVSISQTQADDGISKSVLINPPVGNLYFRLKK